MRGSVLDLAVGVVIGSAFTAIVTQVVEGLITLSDFCLDDWEKERRRCIGCPCL